MPSRPTTAAPDRLRANPAFVQALSLDGRPCVALDAEPSTRYWLNERERVLLSLFSARYGSTLPQATAAYFRLTGASDSPGERQRLGLAMQNLQAAGVLMAPGQEDASQGAPHAADDLAQQPLPRDLATHIVERAGVTRGSRILELADGPGDLALALAHSSDQVSFMSPSRGALALARRRAQAAGVSLTPLHDTCTRLVFRDDSFEVVILSQALQGWDLVQLCRGLCRVLTERGHFFVLSCTVDLDPKHPLLDLLGRSAARGLQQGAGFGAEMKRLQRHLSLLFEALGASEQPCLGACAPASHNIVAEGVSFFEQTRPFGPAQTRALVSAQQIATTGQSPAAFWRDLQTRCAAAPPAQLLGQHHWGVLHFRRGATPLYSAQGQVVTGGTVSVTAAKAST